VGALAGRPVGGIVQHLPSGTGGVAQPLAVLVGRDQRRDSAVELNGDPLGSVQCPSDPHELWCAQRRHRGQIGAFAHALGSDHVELETIADELVAVTTGVGGGRTSRCLSPVSNRTPSGAPSMNPARQPVA